MFNFEFWFCPYHGVFSATNIAFIITYGNVAWTEIECLIVRYWTVIGRWL